MVPLIWFEITFSSTIVRVASPRQHQKARCKLANCQEGKRKLTPKAFKYDRSRSQVLDDTDVKKASQPMVEPRAETLWDIEIEKENVENNKNRNRRATQLLNQNILPTVSSTGVLVESLNKTNSTIDFVFILNVRESESFPPLLLQSDIQCVENRMSSLGAFPQASEIVEWQKNFLKECLKNRLMNTMQPEPQRLAYETQITIVRLSISCTCSELNPQREVCSTFKNINQQKWTEFMGNQLDGTYSN